MCGVSHGMGVGPGAVAFTSSSGMACPATTSNCEVVADASIQVGQPSRIQIYGTDAPLELAPKF